MRTKILAGLVGMCIIIPALIFIQWPIVDVLLMVFAALAAFELCNVIGMKNKPLMWASTVAAPLVVLLMAHPALRPFELGMFPLMMLVGLVMVVLFLAQFKKTTFQHLMFACTAAFVVPAAASTFLLVRNLFLHDAGRIVAIFAVLIVLTCAWLTDAMAYFCGKAFGKRKLCPSISPNKTWAGAVGGVLCTTGINLLLTAAFIQMAGYAMDNVAFILVGLASLVLCPIAIMGDLLASTLKRNLGIKDFGKLMPGHGGALDRFDSFLLVAPTMWAGITALYTLSGGLL
ncbi:MAG: phosphatidate cytidylyltransferase [Oscillospiraceae bacterium]|nr:phosphatidate cytidylyltransferase [Oscillospiraceae bacterium]